MSSYPMNPNRQGSGRVGRIPGQYQQKADLQDPAGLWPPKARLPVHFYQVIVAFIIVGHLMIKHMV